MLWKTSCYRPLRLQALTDWVTVTLWSAEKYLGIHSCILLLLLHRSDAVEDISDVAQSLDWKAQVIVACPCPQP